MKMKVKYGKLKVVLIAIAAITGYILTDPSVVGQTRLVAGATNAAALAVLAYILQPGEIAWKKRIKLDDDSEEK